MRDRNFGPKGRQCSTQGRTSLRVLISAIAAITAFLAFTASASAITPTIVNTNNTAGIPGWLEGNAMGNEQDNSGPASAREITVTALVQHDPGVTITALRLDDNYDGTINPAGTANKVPQSIQEPTIIGGYDYTRATLTYSLPVANSGITKTTFLGVCTGGTRRVSGKPIHMVAVMSNGQTTPVVSSSLNFTSASSCAGPEDYPYIISRSQNQTEINTGQSVTFTYRGDDPDSGILGTGDHITFNGILWRARRLSDGATTTPVKVCQGGDNVDTNLTVNFPNRGRWVVEANLLTNDSSGCGVNDNPNHWFRLGTVDVNSPAANSPTISLSATRPQINGTSTVQADFDDPSDTANGGKGQDLEWDRNGDQDYVDTAGTNPDFAVLGDWLAGLSSPRTTTINTTGMTPGLKTVCARIGDNGALAGSDNIRRTKQACTQYLIDTPPVANAQNLSVESDATLPITLTASDVDNDTLTYTITDPPDHGVLSGSGASRSYNPDDNFAGTDTFTFQVADGFGGTHTAIVTIRVTPATNIDAAPDTSTDPLAGRSTGFEFSSPVPGVTFECQLDDKGFVACNTPLTYQDLSDGGHDFAVRAIAGGAGGPYVDPTPDTSSFEVDAFPVLTITQEPDSSSSSTSATIAFTADEPGSTQPVVTECKLDNGPRRPCDSPTTYTDLSSGQHTITVYATDSRGKEVSETRQFEIDADAPITSIDSGPPATSTSDDPSFTFSSSEPNSTFECALDTVVFTPCTSPQAYTDLSQGDHTFRVVATDSFGTADPTPATYTFVIDSIAPDTSASAAPTGPTRTPPQFTFSSEPGSTFECRLDSDAFAPCDSPFEVPDNLADGDHTFEVRATDTAGNTDQTPESRSFTLDRVAPTTQIDDGPAQDSTISQDSATFDFSSADGGNTFECSVDGADYEPCASGTELTGLDEGDHSFDVRSRDAAGNTGAPASRDFSVDTTAPQTVINSGPAGTVRTQDVAFTFSSPNDDVADFSCSLDGALFEACTSPKSYTGLSDGSHTFQVAATDAASNADSSPAQRSFTIDTSEQPPPNEPPDPPDPPVVPDCTFGEDLPTCGPPSMFSKLRVFIKTSRANLTLNTDTGGAAVNRAVFRLPKSIKVTSGAPGAGKRTGAVVLNGGARHVVPLTVPGGTRGKRTIGSDGGTLVVIQGRMVTVTTPDDGVTQVNLRLMGRATNFVSTKRRCGTLAFRVALTDSANKRANATSRSEAPCPQGGRS